MNRRRRTVSACLAVVALGALGACSSKPGNRRVVSDVIESLQLPASEEACMMERLEGYTDDELDQIADDNENWDPAEQGDTPADATEGMQLFIEDFHECTTEPGAAPTGTSEPTGSTQVPESAASTDSTAATETTESTESTDSTDSTSA